MHRVHKTRSRIEQALLTRRLHRIGVSLLELGVLNHRRTRDGCLQRDTRSAVCHHVAMADHAGERGDLHHVPNRQAARRFRRQRVTVHKCAVGGTQVLQRKGIAAQRKTRMSARNLGRVVANARIRGAPDHAGEVFHEANGSKTLRLAVQRFRLLLSHISIPYLPKGRPPPHARDGGRSNAAIYPRNALAMLASVSSRAWAVESRLWAISVMSS